MSHLTVRKVDPDIIRRLELRAAANRRSLEAEHRAILEEALRPRAADFWEEAARLRERLAGRDFGDSTEIVRQVRDERIAT